MTVDVIDKERQMVEYEISCHKPFIGYIAPNGDLIDYNRQFGESGHDGWDNIVTNTFLQFVSYILKGTSDVVRGISFNINENDIDFDEFLNKLDELLEYKTSNDRIRAFQYQMLLFLKKAYVDRNFFETTGIKIEVTSEKDFMLENSWVDSYDFTKKHYLKHLKLELMQYFKDIVVCYLGYDSIERFKTNGDVIQIPYDSRKYGSFLRPYSSYFYYTPRIITTSYSNINERFYNYLLMDWAVHKVPRYFWNELTLKFEQELDYQRFYCNEKEEIFKKEIQVIRKLVPLNERYKYFR